MQITKQAEVSRTFTATDLVQLPKLDTAAAQTLGTEVLSNAKPILTSKDAAKKIVADNADEIATSRVYTSDGWAGYLIYKNYPRQKVFFDDRHHYFGEPIIADYLKIGAGSRQGKTSEAERDKSRSKPETRGHACAPPKARAPP